MDVGLLHLFMLWLIDDSAVVSANLAEPEPDAIDHICARGLYGVSLGLTDSPCLLPSVGVYFAEKTTT